MRAVDDVTFDAQAGRVTGFLGPNGAGKSTTLRTLLGLIHPTSGTATFGGTPYAQLEHPSRQVGAVLEEASFHPGRSGRNHLRVLATAGGHPEARVEHALTQVGMTEYADRRVKGYSMGMRQRLAIAAALLGDPEVLILDEPTNGLDPPGIASVRGLLRAQAEAGRAVLVSSHLLAEVAQSVDDVVVIARGSVRAMGPLEEVLGGGTPETEVRAGELGRLAEALERRALAVRREGDALLVAADPAAVGQVALEAQVALSGLTARRRSLEEAFLELTA